MAVEYFKINNLDCSYMISSLKVAKNNNFNAQTNAAGDTIVDLINTKRVITVEFIPLTRVSGNYSMDAITMLLNRFNVSISYLNPDNNTLEENVNCIVATHEIEYYTIQDNKKMFKPFTVTFTEL